MQILQSKLSYTIHEILFDFHKPIQPTHPQAHTIRRVFQIPVSHIKITQLNNINIERHHHKLLFFYEYKSFPDLSHTHEIVLFPFRNNMLQLG